LWCRETGARDAPEDPEIVRFTSVVACKE
jgi:hypothetical protein